MRLGQVFAFGFGYALPPDMAKMARLSDGLPWKQKHGSVSGQSGTCLLAGQQRPYVRLAEVCFGSFQTSFSRGLNPFRSEQNHTQLKTDQAEPSLSRGSLLQVALCTWLTCSRAVAHVENAALSSGGLRTQETEFKFIQQLRKTCIAQLGRICLSRQTGNEASCSF